MDLFDALRVLKEECANQPTPLSCDKCDLCIDGDCLLVALSPCNWDIDEIEKIIARKQAH